MKHKTCKITKCTNHVSSDDMLLCDKCFLYTLSYIAASDRVYLTQPEVAAALKNPGHPLYDQIQHWYKALKKNQFWYIRQINILQKR